MKKRKGKLLACALLAASAVFGIAYAVPRPASANASQLDASTLPACPFWAGDVTPPPRPITPFVPPEQTASPLDFSSRPASPTLTGTLVNGQVNLTVARVPGAVAYRIWRDGVVVGWISDWGQPAITAVDTSPCQNAYYTVVALSDNSGSDASMSQMSAPYFLGVDGTIAQGAASPPVGTTINMLVTSYNDGGQTASGFNTRVGMCATDPRIIPWGTYFTVPDYGTCFVGDIGTWISNDAVDLWLPGSQAANWGVQQRTITIIADPFPAPTDADSRADPDHDADRDTRRLRHGVEREHHLHGGQPGRTQRRQLDSHAVELRRAARWQLGRLDR